MNNQFFNPNVSVNPPIIHTNYNEVHRVFVTEQPHICETQTKFVNHFIKRHTYCPRNVCCEENLFCEENLGCCPFPMGPGFVAPGRPVQPRPFPNMPR